MALWHSLQHWPLLAGLLQAWWLLQLVYMYSKCAPPSPYFNGASPPPSLWKLAFGSAFQCGRPETTIKHFWFSKSSDNKLCGSIADEWNYINSKILAFVAFSVSHFGSASQLLLKQQGRFFPCHKRAKKCAQWATKLSNWQRLDIDDMDRPPGPVKTLHTAWCVLFPLLDNDSSDTVTLVKANQKSSLIMLDQQSLEGKEERELFATVKLSVRKLMT